MITSTKSSKVKYIVKLQQKARFRHEEGLFVCEGKRLVLEVPRGLLKEVFVSQSFLADRENEEWLDELMPGDRRADGRGGFASEINRVDGRKATRVDGQVYDNVMVEIVSVEAMAKMAGTVHPQGVLAVVRQPSWSVEDVFGEGSAARSVHFSGGSGEGMKVPQKVPLIVFLENIQDPGNLGTIVRAAEAAGATGIVASAGTADIFSPKVVRSTMGSIFRLPYIETENFAEALWKYRERGVRLLAAVLDAESRAYDTADMTTPVGLIIGNEGAGLTDEAVAACDEKIYIPMQGAESLNASVATGVLLFEAARQRRNADMV